jgi:ribosome-interacting GTPase 1
MGTSKSQSINRIDKIGLRVFLSNILEIFNAEVLFRDDCTSDEFVDVILGSRVYMPCLYVSKYKNYILNIISCVKIF